MGAPPPHPRARRVAEGSGGETTPASLADIAWTPHRCHGRPLQARRKAKQAAFATLRPALRLRDKHETGRQALAPHLAPDYGATPSDDRQALAPGCSAYDGSVAEAPEVLTPQQAARALGVSPSGLRRLASIYERVRGRLPREGAARVWPRETITELKRARELVANQRASSIEAALDTDSETVDLSEDLAPSSDNHTGPAIERLLQELVSENHAIREELRALRNEVAELRALPTARPTGKRPDEASPEGGFWQRFRYYWRRG